MSERPEVQIIRLPAEQAQQLFHRIQPRIDPADHELIVAVFNSVPQLLQLLENRSISSKTFQRMLFGQSTEKTAQVLPTEPQNPAPREQKKHPGHGRNGAKDYPGALTVSVSHPQIHPGDTCPSCNHGHIYGLKDPGKIIHIVAQPIFPATLFNLEKLRCDACGEVFTAPPPAAAGDSKYDPNVGCQLGIMHYGYGLPMTRIQTMQKNLGVPLPVGTQCQLIQNTAAELVPVFEELERQAAQSNLFHTDDTHILILDVAKEIKAQTDEQHDSERKRTGLFTTGMIARTDDHDIVLYYTGRQHAGENLSDLLSKRSKDLPPPMLMCDALSRNTPKEFQIILANCMSHGRRRFVDVAEIFPNECRRMLEDLSQIYHFDALAREQKLSPQARLEFHQANSGPIVDPLQGWMQNQLAAKLVEPNSRLGEAFKYMLKHWQALTRFLDKPGAPLDNNLAERILKKAILRRKNSLFYKTLNGAHIGDIFMSLIQTCQSCGANAFEYLTALVRNPQRVKNSPGRWLPWNFKTALPPNDSA